VNSNIVSFHHTMAMKRHLEVDEIERQLIFDSHSDCCTKDVAHDWGYEDEDDEELVETSSWSPSSWTPPQTAWQEGCE
jgi:hypothetical protein